MGKSNRLTTRLSRRLNQLPTRVPRRLHRTEILPRGLTECHPKRRDKGASTFVTNFKGDVGYRFTGGKQFERLPQLQLLPPLAEPEACFGSENALDRSFAPARDPR